MKKEWLNEKWIANSVVCIRETIIANVKYEILLYNSFLLLLAWFCAMLEWMFDDVWLMWMMFEYLQPIEIDLKYIKLVQNLYWKKRLYSGGRQRRQNYKLSLKQVKQVVCCLQMYLMFILT